MKIALFLGALPFGKALRDREYIASSAFGRSGNTEISAAIHSGEGPAGEFHLDMWIPEFEAAGIKFCVLVRNRQLYSHCRKHYKKIPCVFLKTAHAAENIQSILPSLRTVYYPSNTGNNQHLLQLNRLTHVFLGHGDSDKSSSAHKFFRAYDEIWVAGQAHIDRITQAGFETRHLQFKNIGRPGLRDILSASEGRPWENRFAPHKALYLPTWEGGFSEQSYSSLPMGEGILNKLHTELGCGIGIKLHPLTGTLSNDFLAVKKTLHTISGLHVYKQNILAHKCLLDASFYICDVSGVVSECLAAQGPIFLYLPEHGGIKISASKLPLSEFCYTFSTTDDCITQIASVLNGNDPLRQKREQAVEYFISKKQTMEDAFACNIQALSIQSTA